MVSFFLSFGVHRPSSVKISVTQCRIFRIFKLLRPKANQDPDEDKIKLEEQARKTEIATQSESLTVSVTVKLTRKAVKRKQSLHQKAHRGRMLLHLDEMGMRW